jgi:hypothetical protein
MDPDQTAQSGSILVANALCWFCRDAAHIYNRSKNNYNTASMSPSTDT